jgi:hypothetical protein
VSEVELKERCNDILDFLGRYPEDQPEGTVILRSPDTASNGLTKSLIALIATELRNRLP